MRESWLGKPYYSLDAFFKQTYGEKCYKIALDAGMTCPNRDGTLGNDGCIFCSAGGSGDFAAGRDAGSVREQLQKGRLLFGGKKTGNRFVAYFQAYTNTYAPVSYLREIYTEALKLPEVIGISIATRPDCLGKEVLSLLSELKESYPDKFIWIELGLQTIHEKTAVFINRGFSLPVFEKAVSSLSLLEIPVIVHVILGLPGESPEEMYATCSYLNHIPVPDVPGKSLFPFGIKLQLLHILKGTKLGNDYLGGMLPGFSPLSLEAYTDILIHCLELLNPEIVIHRLTGDGPKALLLAPLWSLDKRNVLNTLHKTVRLQNSYQGRCFHDAGSSDPL